MTIFLLGSSFGILKVYGGARRNHGGAGRSCRLGFVFGQLNLLLGLTRNDLLTVVAISGPGK